ncbi:MAG: aquaporin [Candidatus Peribacteraceae bacterium]|nr:aquaporin [Candidatus Peribacteraceae bacterium]
MSAFARFLTELIGTFLLALVVVLSQHFALPVSAAVTAAVMLGTLVYLFGTISGAHVNPAVTMGMLFIKKISFVDALLYFLAQICGGLLAAAAGWLATRAPYQPVLTDAGLVNGIGEVMGAFMLVAGIASVVYKQTPPAATGLVVGASLFLGISIASPFSSAFLNPAVALAAGVASPMYLAAPLVGGVLGAYVYKFLFSQSRVPAPVTKKKK